MAKKLYTEVNGASRKVKKLYTEVGGVSHKVKKLYMEVNGVSRLVYLDPTTYFSRYEQSMGNLIGSYVLTEDSTGMLARISGYTGGQSYTCAMGWQISGFPAGADVELVYDWYKGMLPMHDVIVYSANGTLATHSEALKYSTETLRTTNHTGWLMIIINFFPPSNYATTSYFTIKKLSINGEVVWTV